jgi:hypothetical protein
MRYQIWRTKARLVPATALAALLLAACASGPPPTSVPVPGMERSLVVEDPRVYQDLFQKIERARFIREGLER